MRYQSWVTGFTELYEQLETPFFGPADIMLLLKKRPGVFTTWKALLSGYSGRSSIATRSLADNSNILVNNTRTQSGQPAMARSHSARRRKSGRNTAN
jgi:hypothetical protein